ncbi:hypothetical protein KKE26_07920 [bacterium]|nr:hypothetical protein [bacterium]MBU1753424.1 hypothetical protein [bacterium]
MKYPLHELTDKEFEKLVALICEQILGTGTITFSAGKDGGRGAEFTGRANKFPSKAKPWEGRFIIQAKHTTKPIASCSDSDFKTILKKEVNEKVKILKEEGKVDYYLLFTNRKLSGIQSTKIDNFIDENAEVENRIIGEEHIQLWLQEYPQIAKTLDLDKLLLPLQFYEEDLKGIIIAFANTKILSEKIKKITDDISRIDIERKNELNKMSKEYFDLVFKKSFSEFGQIKSFLEDPRNRELKDGYDNTISDLQAKITVSREEYETFEKIIEYLFDFIFENNVEQLRNQRRLIRVFFHYMYFNCDIGRAK